MAILIRDIGELLSFSGVIAKDGRRIQEADLGVVGRACLVLEGDEVLWAGPQKKLPRAFAKSKKISREISVAGADVMPAFVECHTHSLFAGSRAREFERRLRGASYAEIAAAGGGITSTVNATRQATNSELLSLARDRRERFVRQGVAVLEVKSGYGLSVSEELRLLGVLQKLSRDPKSLRLVPTFLGAHAVPREAASAVAYLQELESKVLPVLPGLGVERVDIFIEAGFFSLSEGKSFLKAAQNLGLDILIHADQLSRTGASHLGVELGASSVDHVICASQDDVEFLARSKTTAVLLPAADLYLRCPYPPARALIDAGAQVALATDFNPGTSPTQDLSLVGLLARLEMRMTLPEVLAAYTYNSWRALAARRKSTDLSGAVAGRGHSSAKQKLAQGRGDRVGKKRRSSSPSSADFSDSRAGSPRVGELAPWVGQSSDRPGWSGDWIALKNPWSECFLYAGQSMASHIALRGKIFKDLSRS